MPGPQDLSAAIRVALAQPRRNPTVADIVREAKDALAVIEASMQAVADMRTPAHTERGFLVNQLLRASCDHARSIAFLLGSNPMDLAGSAMVLQRSQIEQFLRAVFFDADATDAELARFLQHDEMPKRPGPEGKLVRVHVNALAKIASRRLGFEEDDKLALMVQDAWDPLCGMVHGGRSLRALYRGHDDVIGCLVPPKIQFHVLSNAVLLTNLALAVAVKRAGLDATTTSELLERPLATFEHYQQAREARMRDFV